MAAAWYRHRSYRFEPDLNTDNPAVREEIRKIATFWLRATFLRNHGEVDLGRLTGQERQEVFAVFAPEADMQLYGRGIREP